MFLCRELQLKRPIYLSTATYGHFGRPDFTWEQPKVLHFWLNVVPPQWHGSRVFLFLLLLIISPEMTCKTGKMSVHVSVRPSVHASMQCQHFQNPKAPRLLCQRRWNLACVVYGSWDKTSRKRNFELWPPVPCQPKLSPVGRDDSPWVGCLLWRWREGIAYWVVNWFLVIISLIIFSSFFPELLGHATACRVELVTVIVGQ